MKESQCYTSNFTKDDRLDTINPKLSAEWHPVKNGLLTPSKIRPKSAKKVWWKCPICEHEWQAIVSNRSAGRGCPGCSGHVTTHTNNLLIINPILAAEWHPTKNGTLTPHEVTAKSGKKVWWKCPVCEHEWQEIVANRSRNRGCPACSGHATTHTNNLLVINPKLAAEWHPTKNRPLTPREVTAYSSKKVWWKCPICEHEWQAVIASRSRGNGCPGCSGHVVTHTNNLLVINPKLAAEWHPTKNGPLTPREVTAYSSKKVWWKCPICEHEWQAIIASRSNSKKLYKRCCNRT